MSWEGTTAKRCLVRGAEGRLPLVPRARMTRSTVWMGFFRGGLDYNNVMRPFCLERGY